MSLATISAAYVRYLPLIEKYLLAENKENFLNSLDPFEKKYLQALVNPINLNNVFQQQYHQAGLPNNIINSLIDVKLLARLRQASNQMERENVLKQIVKRWYSDIKFDHPQPTEHTATHSSSSNKENKQENRSTLMMEKTLQSHLQKLVEADERKFGTLDDYGVRVLGEKYLMQSLTFNNKKKLLQRMWLLRTFSDEFVVKFICEIAKNTATVREQRFSQAVDDSTLRQLSQSQINLMKEIYPDIKLNRIFMEKWFQTNYLEHLEVQKGLWTPRATISELNQRRELLLKTRNNLLAEESQFLKSYAYSLFVEVLFLDLERQDPHKQLFYEFLNQQSTRNRFLSLSFGENVEQRRVSMHFCPNLINIDKVTVYSKDKDTSQLIPLYLEKMFRKYNADEAFLKELCSYLDSKFVLQMLTRTRLQMGQHVPDAPTYLSAAQLEVIKRQKLITIQQEKAQKQFSIRDKVSLPLRLKNVHQLRIKLYWINLEQFYLENPDKQLDQTVNLHYLNPTSEELVEITNYKSQYHVLNQNLILQAISGATGSGVYVVDIQGNGLSSRAVIRKGSIVWFEEKHIDGKLLRFYDEEGQLLKNLKLWIDGRQEILQNGEYLIPFSNRTNKALRLVAVRDNYASKIDIWPPKESYTLTVDLLYHQESFLVGRKARIILHSILRQNDAIVSLKNLSNIRVETFVINNQDIKSSFKQENAVFSDEKDFLLEIPIKAFTKKILVKVSAEVKDLEGTNIELEDSKTIDINLLEDTQNVLDIYFKRTNRGDRNTLSVLGLNGQIYPGIEVLLDLQVSGTSEQTQCTLKTDQKGQIHLGTLKYVKTLRASVRNSKQRINRLWTIEEFAKQAGYFNEIQYDLTEGEKLHLPLPKDWGVSQCNFKQFLLLTQQQKKTHQVFQNRNNSICIRQNQEGSFLEIDNLQAGGYTLHFLKIRLVQNIRVHEGKKWKSGELFNEKEGKIIKFNRQPHNYICLGHHEEKLSEKTRKVTIPILVSDSVKNSIREEELRVHVQLKNYHSSETQDYSINWGKTSQRSSVDYFTFKFSESTYYSNKTLSDEHSYVLNRVNEKKFIGNSLQKPRLFLKRIENRETSENQEVLRKEMEYCTSPSQECYDYCSMARQSANGLKQAFKRQNIADQTYSLNSHNNFLKNSGHQLNNIKFRPFLQFQVPNNYTQMTVTLFSSDSAILKNYFFEESQEQITKKDLRHKGLPESQKDKGWSMSRQVYKLQQGEKKSISRDSIWCTFSKENLLQLAQIKGHQLPKWISHWHSWSKQKKLDVYDKEVCHQLNVFLSRTDPQFFKTVVKPFISNKLTPTFVDLCLLADQNCLAYASSHKITQLNAFQKVLLVEELARRKLNQQAQAIAQSMILAQKTLKKNFQQYKILFDMVINAEAPQQKTPKLKSSIPPRPPGMNLQGGGGGSEALFGNQAKFGGAMNSFMMDFSSQDLMQSAMDEENQRPQRMMRFTDTRQDENQVSFKRKNKKLRHEGARNFKPGFKEVEKTKEYTQTTYKGCKDPRQAKHLINSGLYWAQLAVHLSKNPHTPFISDSLIYFIQKREFVLACCFLPIGQSAKYELNNQADSLQIQANNHFLIFVKDVKQLPSENKFGTMINQRFFDPEERYTYDDDGAQIEKTVDEFIVKKVYELQTIITNISGNPLQLQVLIDIPEGAIPVRSHEYVRIQNVAIGAYSTVSVSRKFYFPTEGTYKLYPANASRNNIIVGSASAMDQGVKVQLSPLVKKMQSFSDVMRSGSDKQILQYVEKRNIFDRNVFSAYSILWKLRDVKFYKSLLKILRARNYFDSNIWSYGIFHSDYQTIQEYLERNCLDGLRSSELPVFEYFPYFSSRAHRFMDEQKSIIRNVQFKESYERFLVGCLLENIFTAAQKVILSYYLMLQDRIDEADQLLSTLNEKEKKQHQLQIDYLLCYLSISRDYPNFTTARKLASTYKEYPVETWRKLFLEVYNSLEEFQNDTSYQEEKVQKQQAVHYQTHVTKEQKLIKISVPPQTRVQVFFYDINLELYFSDYPFADVKSMSLVKPKEHKVFSKGNPREEQILHSDFKHLGNMIVQVYEFKDGVPPRKVNAFFWPNPALKVKVNQNQGNLQVFYEGKKELGCYVKVYTMGKNGERFYRDGYTDITGSFKYAMADLDGVSKFSILTLTQQGGLINTVAPPSRSGRFE